MAKNLVSSCRLFHVFIRYELLLIIFDLFVLNQIKSCILNFSAKVPGIFRCFSWMVCEIRGKCPYNCCFVRCHFPDLFKTLNSMFVLFLSSYFSMFFVKVKLVPLYNSNETTPTLKNFRFILSNRCDFQMVDNLSKILYAFPTRM